MLWGNNLSSPQLSFYINMSGNPNSKKHKAMHGGYRQKPTRSQVNAVLNLYASVATEIKQRPIKKVEGAQLKLEF